MVFKRVLKGIGRLMLTTAVMCGVGLFLCSSEVKADSLSFNYNGDKIEIVLTVATASPIDLSGVDFDVYKDSSSAGSKLLASDDLKAISSFNSNFTTTGSDESVILTSINKATFLEKINRNNLSRGENKIVLKCSKSGIDADISLKNSSSEEITVFKIDAPSLSVTKYETDVNAPTYTITTPSASGSIGYGYKGEKYTITSSASGDDYYVNYGDGTAVWSETDAFKPANTPFEGTLGTTTIPTTVQYFPRFTQVWYDIPPAEGTVYLGSDSTKTKSFNTKYIKFGKSKLDDTTPSNDRKVILSNMAFVPNLNGSSNINKWSGKYDSSTSTVEIKFGDSSNKALANLEQVGVAKVSAVALKPGASSSDPGTTPVINNATCPSPASLNVYAYPTGVAILKNGSAVTSDKINISATNEYNLKVLPGGADQTIDYATVNATGYSHASFSKDNNKLKITGTTSGTDNITVTAKVKTGESTTIDKTANLAVTVVAFDKDKTVSKINGSNENYITVGDYKLDVASLVSKYATDGTNHIDGITPKAIKITSGSEYAEVVDSTKIKGKKEGTVELSIFLNTTDTSTTPDLTGVKIGVYPMPTATYNRDNRTLSVKIPTKVATAYSDDNNIRQSKGFKLILEDSSGNTLYEYTDSKYQSVLSSSSESTVTYTVPAADIEGMVTSAASNGKFSADTTSVKFKVIPMGYKQSSTSDETIKAKDEIAGKTDAVTVYKVSASGTNFTSSAAYGLDGQTVSITATPNSGYSFKQWSDGNTSNPRQVKVSASGTRSFQAVAGDRVANSTGAGGTDNSELYDDVPKTAESNSAIWLIVFMVFAVMGTTYALYLQLKAANSKHDR